MKIYIPVLWASIIAFSCQGARAQEIEGTTKEGTFTGAAAGKGLDLQGDFAYAIDIGGSENLKVGAVTFTGDEGVKGLSWEAVNHIPAWAPAMDFGPDESDANLGIIVDSIRWTGRPGGVLVDLDVVPGTLYKLQLLFGEKCCDRGFDVKVEDKVVFNDFNPGVTHERDVTKGAFVSYVVRALDNKLNIDLNGTDAPFPDGNAILSGVTLERVSAATEDPNLVGAPSFDFGKSPSTPAVEKVLPVTNAGKTKTLNISGAKVTGAAAANFAVVDFPKTLAPGAGGNVKLTFDGKEKAGTYSATLEISSDDPAEAVAKVALTASVTHEGAAGAAVDSDGDGLSDKDEITAKTNPLVKDTDGDGLEDGPEVATHKTDPTKRDSDGDSVSDTTEIALKTNPNDASSVPAEYTEVATFSGGDEGDGLDMKGDFVYAVNIRGPGGSKVGDATFTADDETPGFEVVAQNEILNWNNPNFGSSANDDGIELVMRSIRWSANPEDPTMTMQNLTVGQKYVLQVLFMEACCDRGFDVVVNEKVVAQKVNPGVLHERKSTLAAVVRHVFTAKATTLTVVLSNDDETLEFPDKNPIVSGITLKRFGSASDSDGDGLADSWERTYFNNTSATAAGDPDGDKLDNKAEFDRGTNPTVADTDKDGINDGEEVATTKTDPTKADTDGDGLADGAEPNYKTNPTLADTDGDSVADGTEVLQGTDPTKSDSKPAPIVPAKFKGGDAGEGLDFDGNFLYALNLRGEGGFKIRDAQFTDDSLAAFTHEFTEQIEAWHAPEYGDTNNDNNLEVVMQSIRWRPGPINMSLTGLKAGSTYKLQLLMAESCCNRGWDIVLEGVKLLDDFNVQIAQGGINVQDTGVVVAVEFVAPDDVMNLLFLNQAPKFPDNNPILNGLTLEVVKGDTDGGDTDGDGLTNGAERDTYKTNPLVADSDADGAGDGMEVLLKSNPLDKNSKPAAIKATTFKGGDAGEGLDLDGKFSYAINLRGPGNLKVRDANFTADNIAGFTHDFTEQIPAWHAPAYGDTTNDDNLELVMQSIRWRPGPVNMTLANLKPGADYKLQLLFAESCCDRGWDILVEGASIFDNFNVQLVQGGTNVTDTGVVVTVPFKAIDETLNLRFLNQAPEFPDNNPILNGLTLEEGDGAGPVAAVDSDKDGVSDTLEAAAGTDPKNPASYLRATSVGKGSLSWAAAVGKKYTIEYSQDLKTWTAVSNGATGNAVGVGSFSDSNAARLGNRSGFYRAKVE